MKTNKFLVALLVAFSSVVPQAASAVSSFDTPSPGGVIWQTSATSTATWSPATDPNGSYMKFEVAENVTETIDIVITASNGTIDFTNGTCYLSVQPTFYNGQTFTLSATAQTQNSITCRVVITGWSAGAGLATIINVDSDGQENNGYGQVSAHFDGPVINNYPPMNNNLPQNSQQSSNAGNSQQSSNVGTPYDGPMINSGITATNKGGRISVAGKKLTDVSSVKVNGESATYELQSETELNLILPAHLAPGKYDLEITSSYGRLIQYGAITIKAPTQAVNFSLKGSGFRVDANMLTELSNIGSMFNSDYKKITCVANAADAATAQAVADKVCKTLKAGELRSATTKSVAKSTFKGEGYWVRVYLAG